MLAGHSSSSILLFSLGLDVLPSQQPQGVYSVLDVYWKKCIGISKRSCLCVGLAVLFVNPTCPENFLSEVQQDF